MSATPIPQEITRRLTKEQRVALGHMSEKPWPYPLRWHVLVGFSLEHLGLAKRAWLTGKSYITPLGLAVRAALTDGDTNG
jgi:hypothetical protein